MQIRTPIKDINVPKANHIIIDTDAGGDDCQAIILAISQARKAGKVIVGITCIDGNASLKDVSLNVLIAVCLCQADIPIYLGSSMSIMRPTHKDYYFSKDGIGMKQQEYINKLEKQGRLRRDLIKNDYAVNFIVESANKYAQDLAIIAIGPLTNIALAYQYDNSLTEKISLISLMGGSTSLLGIRQFFAAQFNFFLDAEAAKIVIDCFPEIYINSFDLSLNLDVKKTLCLFTQQARQKAKFIHDIHSVILSSHRPAVCDPLAVIPVLIPNLIKTVYEAYANIEYSGLRTKGAITFDWLNKQIIPHRHKIKCVAQIDLMRFMQHINDSYN